jgi:hypothetical protein
MRGGSISFDFPVAHSSTIIPDLLNHCIDSEIQNTEKSLYNSAHVCLGHRASNRLDRLMRGLNRYFDRGQHRHGSRAACRLHCHAWALLGNFAPWHPAMTRRNNDWHGPAERLNQHRDHEDWLQNLLISAPLGRYRCPHPQNP